MTLSEIRDNLLGQHASLRRIAERASALVEQVRKGRAGAREGLRDTAIQLEIAFSQHNKDEEALLGNIISTVDTWGTTRHHLMDYHHAVEHIVLRSTLSAALRESDAMVAGDRFENVLHDLLDHMREEEEQILNVNVLRDDCYTIENDSLGG